MVNSNPKVRTTLAGSTSMQFDKALNALASVHTQTQIYTVNRQLYGKYQLRSSLNTIGLKPPGSVDMKALAFDISLYGETPSECRTSPPSLTHQRRFAQ
jgi:hypothetical protein